MSDDNLPVKKQRPDALSNVPDIDFQLVKEYLATGSDMGLCDRHRKMIRVCRTCYGLMSKYPQRNVLIHELMVMEDIDYKSAAKYVDFTRATWGKIQDFNSEFLKVFFLDQLMREISNPRSKPETKAKNLATLQKYLADMPQSVVDPSLKEQNQIVIQFNLGEGNFQLPQEVIRRLPKTVQEKLFAGINNEITDAEIDEIAES